MTRHRGDPEQGYLSNPSNRAARLTCRTLSNKASSLEVSANSTPRCYRPPRCYLFCTDRQASSESHTFLLMFETLSVVSVMPSRFSYMITHSSSLGLALPLYQSPFVVFLLVHKSTVYCEEIRSELWHTAVSRY